MIRFIFSMLFYGFFLGILLIVCMWFFLGMTIQESIDWVMDKVGQTKTVVVESSETVGTTIRSVGQNVDRQIDRIAEGL